MNVATSRDLIPMVGHENFAAHVQLIEAAIAPYNPGNGVEVVRAVDASKADYLTGAVFLGRGGWINDVRLAYRFPSPAAAMSAVKACGLFWDSRVRRVQTIPVLRSVFGS